MCTASPPRSRMSPPRVCMGLVCGNGAGCFARWCVLRGFFFARVGEGLMGCFLGQVGGWKLDRLTDS